MTQELTSVELQSARMAADLNEKLEIRDKPEDTPRSVIGTRWASNQMGVFSAFGSGKSFFAVASTTQILNPSYPAMNDYILISRDMTARSEEEEVVRDRDWARFIPQEEMPVSEAGPRLSDAEIANRDRLQLLARQYVAGQLSTEEQARLAIVSERVRRLIPRVTVEDFEQLEELARDVERIGAEDVERRRRLGID